MDAVILQLFNGLTMDLILEYTIPTHLRLLKRRQQGMGECRAELLDATKWEETESYA